MVEEVGETDSDALPLDAMFAEDGALPESEDELSLVEGAEVEVADVVGAVGVTDSEVAPPVDATNTADGASVVLSEVLVVLLGVDAAVG